MTSGVGSSARFGAAFALLCTTLAASALVGSVTLYGAVLLLLVALELWVAARRPKVRRAWEAVHLGADLRITVRAGLLVLLVARAGLEPGWLLAATVLVVMLVLLLRAVVQSGLATVRARSEWPVAWRNLTVPGLALPCEAKLPRQARVIGSHAVDMSDLVLAAGLLWVQIAAAPAGFFAAALGMVAVAGLVALVVRRRAHQLPPRDRRDVLAALREALEERGPRVVVYFGGPPTSTHALNVWVPVLERLDVPVLVMVRQREHLEKLASRRLPAVWLPAATDVEAAVVPSIGLALYPTNIVQNNHLLRIPGIVDVFVGHGDSDKGGSATPISRIYDEVWVAGPAGRDRYRAGDVGVRDEQIREVGRPQLAEIARCSPTEPAQKGRPPFTVLYAPTWEGFYASWSYSSLLHMGEEIVARLTGIDGVRVLVKPHPASGSVDKAYARAAERVAAAVRRAGGPHRVVSGLTGLYEAFNEADLLVSDVSSVVTDFLWSRKPYVMCNPADLPEEDFRRQFPSSAGAALWSRDLATLEADIQDARTVDRRREDREAVARHLLGADEGDPQERVAVAVHSVLAAARGGELATDGAATGWASDVGYPSELRPLSSAGGGAR
jgi:hypothetical protein